MRKINELNLAYIKRFMKKKRGWVDQNAVAGLKNITKGGGKIDRSNIKALGHGDLYTKKEETDMNVNEGLGTRKKLQDLLVKHNNASKIDSIPKLFHKMMATRVAAILNKDTEKSKVMKGLAAHELARMKEDELIDPNVMINEDVIDEYINRPPTKGFHIVQHKDSGQHVMVKTKTVGGAQSIKFHPDSKYQHVGAFKSKKHAKQYMDKHLADKNEALMSKAGTAKKHSSGLGIREAVTFKPWSGPFMGKIASARTGTDHKIPMSPEDEKTMMDPKSTREQRLAVAGRSMAWATANAKKKLKENSNSSGALYHGAGMSNMDAYDRLPKQIRHAMANADHNWSASHLKKEYRKNPKVKDAKTAVSFLKNQDAIKHNDDAKAGHIAPGQRKVTEAKKAVSWNSPEVQAKAAKEKKEKKMFASGKKEIDRLKKAGK